MATPARSLSDEPAPDVPTEVAASSVSSQRRRPRRLGDEPGGAGMIAVPAALVGLPSGVPETVVTGSLAVVAVAGRGGYVGRREQRFPNTGEDQ